MQEINVCPKKLDFANEKEFKEIVESIFKYCFSHKQTILLRNEKKGKLLQHMKEILLEVTKNTNDKEQKISCESLLEDIVEFLTHRGKYSFIELFQAKINFL